MWRSTELEGIDDEAELIFCILLAYAENLEHPLLHCSLVDSYRTAAEFRSVEDEIVGIGTYFLKVFLLIAVEQFQVLRLRSGERMVHCIETLSLVVPLHEREIHHPERRKIERITKTEPVTHLDTEYTKHVLGLSLCSAEHKHHVALLRSETVCNSLKLLRSIELIDR